MRCHFLDRLRSKSFNLLYEPFTHSLTLRPRLRGNFCYLCLVSTPSKDYHFYWLSERNGVLCGKVKQCSARLCWGWVTISCESIAEQIRYWFSNYYLYIFHLLTSIIKMFSTQSLPMLSTKQPPKL